MKKSGLFLGVLPVMCGFGVLGEVGEAQALVINRLSSIGNSSSVANNFGAEIPAYDPLSKQLFVIGPNNRIDIANISDPSNPIRLPSIDLGSYGAGVNSIAIKNGIIAVAMEANPITNNGSVVFFNNSGVFQSQVTVGALPDMLTFSPDGRFVVVANEAEARGAIDPDGSVSIIDISGGILSPTVKTAVFTGFDAATLRSQGVRILDGKTAAQDLEPEYITVSDDSTIAWVTLQENNAVATVDLITGTVTGIRALGTKDHNLPGSGLDASDRDAPIFGGATGSPAVNIQNWPVVGLYQPDSIASYTFGGQTYLVTANEGDARDGEEIRVGDISAADRALIPNIDTLRQARNLGRLNVSNRDGRNSQGQYTQLTAFGARSFSIWNANTMTRVYDSGDDFERILSQFSAAPLTPSIFNSDSSAANQLNSFDTRSDNRGPEPEGVVVGRVGNRMYSFVGIERANGFMVYDITNPLAPFFTNYVNDWQLGDRAPEGLLFIPAVDSPNGRDLIVIGNEVSRNTVIYQATPVPEPATVLGLLSVGLTGLFLKKRN